MVLGVLVFVWAAVIQRQIGLPLRRFARAAEEIGNQRIPQPLPEDDVLELRSVARSFNQMSQRIAAYESTRAIMLAGISHDLRTPLTKLRLGLEMIGARDSAMLDSLMQCTVDMEDIIAQFIDFARSESAEPKQLINVNETITALSNQFAKSGYHFALSLGNLPPCQLRPVSVRRMIFNLMNNSVHYAGEGLEVRSGVREDSIWISVCDRGTRLSHEQVVNMMRPFVRLAEEAPGTGLGLAIVQRIAEGHGGTVRLRPRTRGGLEATIFLPIASESDAKPDSSCCSSQTADE
ncbi:hypothetical protein AQ914_04635 [Burkholderia pseudomallei]|nr:hypothetical protein AQ914_04635 [Burkholderia pseudomallei]